MILRRIPGHPRDHTLKRENLLPIFKTLYPNYVPVLEATSASTVKITSSYLRDLIEHLMGLVDRPEMFEDIKLYGLLPPTHKVTTVTSTIFLHDFASRQHRECSLLTYRDQSEGHDCQFVGLLDRHFAEAQFAVFNTDGRQAVLLNTQFLRTLDGHPSTITTVDTYDTYTQKFPKDVPISLIKLNSAYEMVHYLEGGESHLQEVTDDRLIRGEYVLVINQPIPIVEMRYTPLVKHCGIDAPATLLKTLMSSLEDTHNHFNCWTQNVSLEYCHQGSCHDTPPPVVRMDDATNVFMLVDDIMKDLMKDLTKDLTKHSIGSFIE